MGVSLRGSGEDNIASFMFTAIAYEIVVCVVSVCSKDASDEKRRDGYRVDATRSYVENVKLS